MIFDTFTFFNEMDLLEIRLNVLNDVVDQFVLVEATKTQQNKSKPLFYQNNKERFAKFHHKLRHIIVDDMPNSLNARLLEYHQRNAISNGLLGCSPEDQIILSDLDEIPNPDVLRDVAKIRGFKVLRQGLYYYYVNYACQELSDLPWSIMTEYKNFTQPQLMRDRLISIQSQLLSGSSYMSEDVTFVERGGWHFSYLGGIDAIITKIESFPETQYNQPEYKDTQRIRKAIAEGRDLFGRDLSFIPKTLDLEFPAYLLDNKQKYAHLIYE